MYAANQQAARPGRLLTRQETAGPARAEFRNLLPGHIFTTISPPKWAMIKYLETIQDQPMPTPRRGPPHHNPENNRAAPG